MSIMLAGGAAAGQAQSDAQDTAVSLTDHTLSGSTSGNYTLGLLADGRLYTTTPSGGTTYHTGEWGTPIREAIGGYFQARLLINSGDTPSSGEVGTFVLIGSGTDGVNTEWTWKGNLNPSASGTLTIVTQFGGPGDSCTITVDVTVV